MQTDDENTLATQIRQFLVNQGFDDVTTTPDRKEIAWLHPTGWRVSIDTDRPNKFYDLVIFKPQNHLPFYDAALLSVNTLETVLEANGFKVWRIREHLLECGWKSIVGANWLYQKKTDDRKTYQVVFWGQKRGHGICLSKNIPPKRGRAGAGKWVDIKELPFSYPCLPTKKQFEEMFSKHHLDFLLEPNKPC